MTREQTIMAMGKAAAVVKLVCGVGNNAAWLVTLDGFDHARKCKNYKQNVKKAFCDAIEEYHKYERELLHAFENRMFHIDDMGDAIRKKYGKITDRDYYDFWASAGGVAYKKTRPVLTSLWNKYKKSLESHHIPDAEHIAWVMTAMAALELACRMYDRAILECVNGYSLPERIVKSVFKGFDLHRVSKSWKRALMKLEPMTNGIALDDTEKHNIELGLEQLCDAWVAPTLLYDSTFENVEDYGEIFRTKGEQKKSLREIAEARELTNEKLKSKN